MQKALRLLLASTLLAAGIAGAACSSSDGNDAAPDGAPEQAAPEEGTERGAQADGGAPQRDGATPRTPDAATDDGILGTLSGSCGALRARLADPAPALEHDRLTFAAGETYTKDALSPGGQTLFDAPNAGGSSGESEVMSYEVLRTCEGATFLKTETAIAYVADDAGAPSITDLLVEIDGKKVGVSVTRAYKPKSMPLTDVELAALLTKKLEGINRSSVRVAPADKWVRQILHVFAVDAAAAAATERVWKTLGAELRADTLVLVTETAGGGFLYCNPDPPLGSECN